MPQCQFLFSAVFVFQKSCTGNILGIARDKAPVPYFSVTKTKPEGEQQGASQVARQGPGAANPWPAPGLCLGPPGLRRPRPFAIYSPSRENPKHPIRNPRKVPTSPSMPKQDSGDRSLCSGTLPGRGSAPGAISIDLHRHLRHLHRPHRHLHQPCCLL